MIEFNKFYNFDSDNFFLEQLANSGQKFDLILTDPPYNLQKDFGNDSDKLDLNEFIIVNKTRISKCANLLSKTGSIIWFGIHHFIGYLQLMMYDAGLHYRRMNIWRYENGFSRSKRSPRSEYEPFLWFSKSNKQWTFNTDDVRVPYKSKDRLKTPVYYENAQGRRIPWLPNPQGAMRGDIWEFPTLAGRRFEVERTKHPTQKPESLITEILKAYCPKNSDGRYIGSVLDPYAGAGTVGICCERLNRNNNEIKWICNEIEIPWVSASNKRLDVLRTHLR